MNQITDKGCELLAPALAELTALEKLYIRENNITEVGLEKLAPFAPQIAASLGADLKSEEWDLRNKNLTDQDMPIVAELLKKHSVRKNKI